jgi:hypothetical protein
MKDMEAKTAELDRIDSDEALTEVEKEIAIKDWKPEGIDTQNMQGYLLIGKRAMTVIGQAQSVSALQALNSRIIFKSNIESDVSIAMPASDLLKKAESIGKETST